MIRLIASDMDRTLLDEHAAIPPETYQLIDELRELDVRFCVCSGRPASFLLELWAKALDRISIVCSNGSQVFVDGELVVHAPCSHEDIVRLGEAVAGSDWLHACVNDGDTEYVLDEPGSAKARFFAENLAWMPKTVYRMPGPDVAITAGAVVSDDPSDDMRANADLLRERLGDAFDFLPLGTNVMDAVPHGVSKATGLQHVMDVYGVARDEVVGYGDSMNDLVFLGHVGHPVAVANAFPEVKAIAERIIESNVEHGVQRDMARILDECRRAGAKGVDGAKGAAHFASGALGEGNE